MNSNIFRKTATVAVICLAISHAKAFVTLSTAGYAGPVTVRTITALHSGKTTAGSPWEGSITSDVVQDGQMVYRQGTPVQGVVEKVLRKQDGPRAQMSLRIVSIDRQPVHATTYQVDGDVESRKASRTVTGWAISGALVGGILHGTTGAAAGAAAGAGVGAARASGKIRHDAVVPSESLITFEITGGTLQGKLL
ncbi:MAG: hypothetical protein H7039_20810 [Bryobacteraceae bacterium]|nr:hypothetical protein [Bryobacteraceae bacterium]